MARHPSALRHGPLLILGFRWSSTASSRHDLLGAPARQAERAPFSLEDVMLNVWKWLVEFVFVLAALVTIAEWVLG